MARGCLRDHVKEAAFNSSFFRGAVGAADGLPLHFLGTGGARERLIALQSSRLEFLRRRELYPLSRLQGKTRVRTARVAR